MTLQQWQEQQYDTSAGLIVNLIQAAVDVILAGVAHHQQAFEAGTVINVNFPSLAVGPLAGLALTHQGSGCVFPKFLEVTEPAGPHLPEIEEHTPNLRMFRNYAGVVRDDMTEGSDNWAVGNGWVSVTPLSLRSDVPLRLDASCPVSTAARELVSSILHSAADRSQLAVSGAVVNSMA